MSEENLRLDVPVIRNIGHGAHVIFDFDGVIHLHESPWRGADVVADGPVPGAMRAIKDFQDAGFVVCVYSSRSHALGGVVAMQEAIQGWLLDEFAPDRGDEQTAEAIGIFSAIRWPDHKVPAFLSIDDRGFRFEGKFPTPEEIAKFKPWNRRVE